MVKKALRNPAARPSQVPLSAGLIAGPFVFVSGQVGTDPATGELSGQSADAQTRQVLQNVEAVLAEAGLDMNDVVKTTVYLTNMGDFSAMNEVYRQFFSEPMPTRTTVGVAGLARPEFVVEIDVVALQR